MLAAAPVPLYVNAGGVSVVDTMARTFAADSGFTAGNPASTNVDFGSAADNAMFNTSRRGSQVTFHSTLSNGHYALWLDFADTQSTAAGQRVMNVSAEGQPLASALDVFALVGQNKPVAREFEVTVADGSLDLTLTSTSGDAFLNAIVAVPTDVPLPAQPYSWQGLGSDAARRTKSAGALVQLFFSLSGYANSNRGFYPPDLATASASGGSVSLEWFASARTDTQLPRGELSKLEQTAWIASRKDFVYVAAGYRNPSATTITVHENPQRVAGSLNCLYGDGHVATLDRATAGALLGFDPNVPPTGGPAIQTTQSADVPVLQSTQNLLNISTKMGYWANEHSGAYPATPGDTIYYDALPSWFVDPRGTTPPAPTGLSIEEARDFVNGLSDYRYLAGRFKRSAPVGQVLMYENPRVSSEGILLLFADGTVRYQEARWAMETLRRSAQSITTTVPSAEIAQPDPMLPGGTTTLNGAGLVAYYFVNGVLNSPRITTYQWDLNYNGDPADFQIDATGPMPTFVAPSTAGRREVALRVIDESGTSSSVATASIAIVPITISNGATFTLTGSTFTLIAGAATVTADSATINAGMTFVALGNSHLALNSAQHLAKLQLDATSSATTGGLLNVKSLSIGTTASLDLNDNDLIVSNTPRAMIEDYIRTAYNFGGWDGPSGIFSSTAKNDPRGNTTLGLLSGQEFNDNNGGLFNGQLVNSSDVLVKYTYFGDVDFNGAVDSTDYNLIDFGYLTGASGWANGDVDYRGGIDSTDYNLIDFAFVSQGGAL